MGNTAGQISNPAGLNGLGVSVNVFTTEYKAGGTITEGQVVTLSAAGVATKAATDTATALCFGIATESAVSGHSVRVQHLGFTETVTCDASTILAGSALIRSSTTAGSVMVAPANATGVDGVLGVALEANSATAGTITAFLYPSSSFGAS